MTSRVPGTYKIVEMHVVAIIVTTTTATSNTVIISKSVAILQGCCDSQFSVSIVFLLKEPELCIQISLPSPQSSAYQSN